MIRATWPCSGHRPRPYAHARMAGIRTEFDCSFEVTRAATSVAQAAASAIGEPHKSETQSGFVPARVGLRRAGLSAARLRGNSEWVTSQGEEGRNYVPKHPGCADRPDPLLRRCHRQHLLAPSGRTKTAEHQNGAVSAGRGARCFFWLWIEPVVSTASERLTEALATASGALKDALTYIQTVMHVRPIKATITARSIAVLLCLLLRPTVA
jgi:hypothetical protein